MCICGRTQWSTTNTILSSVAVEMSNLRRREFDATFETRRLHNDS